MIVCIRSNQKYKYEEIHNGKKETQQRNSICTGLPKMQSILMPTVKSKQFRSDMIIPHKQNQVYQSQRLSLYKKMSSICSNLGRS